MTAITDLPYYGVIYVYATAERITYESASNGDWAEAGWVDSLSSSTIWESRNYVRPIAQVNVSDLQSTDIDKSDDAIAELSQAIDRLGAYESDDGSTLYAADAVTNDYADPEGSVFLYALHAFVKHAGSNTWVEEPIDILTLTGK